MLISARESLKVLESELEQIQNSTEEPSLKTNQCLDLTKRYCEDLLQKIISYEFKDVEEQIDFFKNIKPHVFSLYFYFEKIKKIESKFVGKGKLSRKRIIIEELSKKVIFFDNYHELYQYYRAGKTDCDSKYFSKFDASGFKFIGQKCDEIMFSSHDLIFSKFRAYELIEIYLSDELQKVLSGNRIIRNNVTLTELGIFWTGTLRDFVELISALHVSKVINNGTMSLKQIFKMSLFIFNLNYDIKDVYLVRNQLKQRKKSESSFLEKLKNMSLEEDDFYQ